ncbi:shikimate kinase [Micrococcus sp.]|uniref:shikimate kinase n=1 Tax=Micrococcus sp. TaxID=1271 RepID=UPI002A90B13F|nr:shikimate kinase [Micrococcus sp.]MDY6055470.1 shikimate kinase [Micrococcus sp.]
MTADHPVVLVGAMGVGKSTVGRAVAGSLGLSFLDADTLFQREHGPIPAYFAEHGEPAFRREEARIVAEALSRPEPCVLACGGGAVLDAGTRALLSRPTVDVVWLTVSEQEALRRVGRGEGRPVLAGDPAATWRRIAAAREPLYREVADLTVDGTGLRPAQTASRIVEGILDLRRSETRP